MSDQGHIFRQVRRSFNQSGFIAFNTGFGAISLSISTATAVYILLLIITRMI